jgi:hypothetical protein
MENTPREKFFEGMRTAPFSAHQFVSAIHGRYDRRNDVEVHYTDTNASDLRLHVFWENVKGYSHQQNFARFEWRAQKGHCLAET